MEKLGHSKARYFDSYELECPDDIIEWVDNRADYMSTINQLGQIV